MYPKTAHVVDKRQQKRDRDAAYRHACAIVKKRDGGRCRNCSAVGSEVHHITARSLGRDDSPANLVLLCHDCHELVTHHYVRIVGVNGDSTLRFEKNEFMR